MLDLNYELSKYMHAHPEVVSLKWAIHLWDMSCLPIAAQARNHRMQYL